MKGGDWSVLEIEIEIVFGKRKELGFYTILFILFCKRQKAMMLRNDSAVIGREDQGT